MCEARTRSGVRSSKSQDPSSREAPKFKNQCSGLGSHEVDYTSYNDRGWSTITRGRARGGDVPSTPECETTVRNGLGWFDRCQWRSCIFRAGCRGCLDEESFPGLVCAELLPAELVHFCADG